MKTTQSAIDKLLLASLVDMFEAIHHRKNQPGLSMDEWPYRTKSITINNSMSAIKYICKFCRCVVSQQKVRGRPAAVATTRQDAQLKAQTHCDTCARAWAIRLVAAMDNLSFDDSVKITAWMNKHKIPKINIAPVGSELYIGIELFCHSISRWG